MKTLLTATIIAISTVSASAQATHHAVGIGFTTFNGSTSGATLQVNYDALYLDVGFNFVTGKGEQLEFRTDKTYETDKTRVASINLGRRFLLGNFRIVPTIGTAIETNIYQDPVGFDTYFEDDPKFKFNVGARLQYRIGNVLLSLGMATYQRFSVGVAFDW